MNYEWKNQGKDNQEKVMKFINEYIDAHGYAPSYSEISAGTGIKTGYAISRKKEKVI